MPSNLSFAQNPAAGLASLELLGNSKAMTNYQLYHAALADMLRRNEQYEMDVENSWMANIWVCVLANVYGAEH